MFRAVLLSVLIAGCLCSEEAPQRETTTVCVEMQGSRSSPPAQNVREESKHNFQNQPKPFQPQAMFQPGRPQGMPMMGPNGMQHGVPHGMPHGLPRQAASPQPSPNGMPQGMMPQPSPNGMPQGMMPPPGMPHMHGMPMHGGMMGPPMFRGPMEPSPFVIINRLQEELAAKDQKIAELSQMLNQQKREPEFQQNNEPAQS